MYKNQDQATLDAMMVCINPSNFSKREVLNIAFGIKDVMFSGMPNAQVLEVYDNLVDRFF